MNLAQEHAILWLALQHVPRLGPARTRQLWQQHESVDKLWKQLELSNSVRKSLVSQAKHEYELLQKEQIQLLTIDKNTYPANTINANSISPVIYAKGHLIEQDQQAVAMVGSRMVSVYGRDVTEHLTAQLVAQEYTIVSGLARGVDTIAHRQALKSGGRTIAVLGCSIDHIYDAEEKELVDEIMQSGAIVSQFPLGTVAQKFTFPERNKLIAALSQAVVVTEAREQSGALITAGEAVKLGRPVFAVPGSIFSPGSKGVHRLLREGAKIAVDAAAIVETLGRKAIVEPKATFADPATAQEDHLLRILQAGQQHIDQLIRASTLSAGEVLAALTTLEMRGLVKQAGRGEYRKT